MLIESAGWNSVASRSTMRGPLPAKPRSRMARRLTGLAVQAATELRKPGWNCSVGAPPRAAFCSSTTTLRLLPAMTQLRTEPLS
jgi:hypothetical protein